MQRWATYPVRCPGAKRALGRSIAVTSVAFCHGGGELVASYQNEQVYMFATAAHARPAYAYGATADLDSRCWAPCPYLLS